VNEAASENANGYRPNTANAIIHGDTSVHAVARE
jgi:hypothetical protein